MAVMEKDRESYLLFTVHDIKLGISILAVREIISPERLEVKPQAPVPFLGEVNLRATQIPVIGLYDILGLPPSDITAKTRILIMEKELNWFGILVDNVLEMAKLEEPRLFPVPKKFTDLDASRFLGVSLAQKELFYLMNADNIILLGELNKYYRLKL